MEAKYQEPKPCGRPWCVALTPARISSEKPRVLCVVHERHPDYRPAGLSPDGKQVLGGRSNA